MGTEPNGWFGAAGFLRPCRELLSRVDPLAKERGPDAGYSAAWQDQERCACVAHTMMHGLESPLHSLNLPAALTGASCGAQNHFNLRIRTLAQQLTSRKKLLDAAAELLSMKHEPHACLRLRRPARAIRAGHRMPRRRSQTSVRVRSYKSEYAQPLVDPKQTPYLILTSRAGNTLAPTPEVVPSPVTALDH